MDKNLKILVGIIILIAVYFFSQTNQEKYIEKETSLLKVKPEQIFSFTITDPSNSITIERNDTTWNIIGHDTLIINQKALDSFFDKVITVKKSTLISKNKNKWGIYSVHDSNATHLSIFNAEKNLLGSFYIGISKSNYANNYIRTDIDDNVYMTSDNIFYYVTPIPNYWGEKPPAKNIEPPSLN